MREVPVVSSLVFVRHAMPMVDSSLPASEWALSEQGVRDSQQVHVPVLDRTRVLASTERKAIHTTSIVTARDSARIIRDPGFNEVRRNEPVDEGYLERRRAWIGGKLDGRHCEWERFSQVGGRMDSALERHLAESMVVGTHGMVLTAWLVRVGLVAPGAAAVRFWEDLKFPDVVVVSRDAEAGLILTRRQS